MNEIVYDFDTLVKKARLVDIDLISTQQSWDANMKKFRREPSRGSVESITAYQLPNQNKIKTHNSVESITAYQLSNKSKELKEVWHLLYNKKLKEGRPLHHSKELKKGTTSLLCEELKEGMASSSGEDVERVRFFRHDFTIEFPIESLPLQKTCLKEKFNTKIRWHIIAVSRLSCSLLYTGRGRQGLASGNRSRASDPMGLVAAGAELAAWRGSRSAEYLVFGRSRAELLTSSSGILSMSSFFHSALMISVIVLRVVLMNSDLRAAAPLDLRSLAW
ncbi:hypothetical protein IEQ34_022539 [Dendrobium chrysotoxum]|uniref:Uncharacterized protein n=1 Tax=Dendrobium chrysotoxum TaxID=161865 RepID=A0AAV7FK69_DENCH|nr:hypothetical protein IEQ34_022539 [Dendrobium chrysotoxum]